MGSFTRYCNYVGPASEPSSGIARVTYAGEEPADHGPLIRQGPPLADRISLIDNVKLESISCELCHQIFEEPTVAGMCGHCFCKPCLVIYKSTKSSQGCPTCGAKISKSSGLPNRSLSTIIDSQRRFCFSRYIFDCSSKRFVELQDGCMFVGSLEQMVEHEAACPLMPVECPQSSCKRLVLRKDLEEHRKAQCWRQCEQCGLDIQIGLLGKHVKDECPETKLSCPRSDIGCHIVLRRRAQGKHLESCPYERYRMDIEALRTSLREKEEEIARLRGTTEPVGGDRKRELNGVLSDADEGTPSKRAKTGEVELWKTAEQHEHVAVSPDNGEQPGDVRKLLMHMVGSVERVLLSGLNGITARVHRCEAKVTALEAVLRQKESCREGLSRVEVTAKADGKHMKEAGTEGASKVRDETAGATRKEVNTEPNGSLDPVKVKGPGRSTGRVIVFKKGRSVETEVARGTQGVKNSGSEGALPVLKQVKKEPFTAVEQVSGKERAEGNGNGTQLREVKRERSPSMARSLGGRTSEERGVPGRIELERKAGRSLEGRAERAKSEQRSNREADGKTDRDLERREEGKPRWRVGQVGHRDYDRRTAREPEQDRPRHDVHRRLEEPGSASSGFHVATHEHGQHAEAPSPILDRDIPAHPSIRCLSFWFRAVDLVSRMLCHPTPTQGRFIGSVVGILQEMQQAQDFRALFQPSSNLEMLEALRQLDVRVQCLIDGRVDYSPEATRAWKVAMDSVPEGVLVYDNWSLIKLEKFVMNKQGGMKYERRFNDELRHAIERERQRPNLPLKQSVLLNSNDTSPSGSDSRPPGFQDRIPFQPPERPFPDRVGPRPDGRFEIPDRDFRRPQDMSPTLPFRNSVRDRILDTRDARRQSDAGSFVSRRSPRYSVFDLDM